MKGAYCLFHLISQHVLIYSIEHSFLGLILLNLRIYNPFWRTYTKKRMKIQPKNPTQNELENETSQTKRINIMHMIFQIMNLAVKHTHTFEWWQVIWKLFLDKDLGNPKLNPLCAIHLIEAKINLL